MEFGVWSTVAAVYDRRGSRNFDYVGGHRPPLQFMYLILLLILFPMFAVGQTRDLSAYEGKPRIQVVHLNVDEHIALDGNLEESAWQRAIPAGNFTQQDPDVGMPATQRTEVRFLMSRSSLYLGVTCYDSEPDK